MLYTYNKLHVTGNDRLIDKVVITPLNSTILKTENYLPLL